MLNIAVKLGRAGKTFKPAIVIQRIASQYGLMFFYIYQVKLRGTRVHISLIEINVSQLYSDSVLREM